MAGYHAFQTGRVSFGDNRPKAPLVDIELVRGPRPVLTAKERASKVRLQARLEPKPGAMPLVPQGPARLEDVQNMSVHPMRRMVALVSYKTGITVHEIKSERRLARNVKARQILFWIARNFTTYSLPEIGRRSGGRDHTTVLHGIRRVQSFIDRLNIEIAACPFEMTERLWAAEWPKASV